MEKEKQGDKPTGRSSAKAESRPAGRTDGKPQEKAHGRISNRPDNRQQSRAPQKPYTPRPKQVLPVEPWDENEFKVPVTDGKTRFHDYVLPKEVMRSVFDLGFQYCTPVQAETLQKSLNGEDVTAQAQTGTGKTAAFLITIYNYILKNPSDKKRKSGTPRALILAPTRELVLQIEKDARGLGKYVPCDILSILGGMDYNKQLQILKNEPCDILICTPGRLLDYMKKGAVDLGKVEILVIDEADRMLNMGFIPDVRRIVLSTPSKTKRQTMFFTATMNTDVKSLAESWTRQAHEITINPEEVAVESVQQITYITTVAEKPTLLYNIIMQKNLERVLVFVNRRDEARRLKETFEAYGITCALLSGDVDQKQRISRLENFRDGSVRVLVATDVASRGIHVEAISHVINYNMPQDIEEYVHRIGRTGRAGAKGVSINFADEDDSYELQKLEDYLGKKIECIFPDENLLVPIPEIYKKLAPVKKVYDRPAGSQNRRPGGGNHGRRPYNKGGQRGDRRPPKTPPPPSSGE
jgi:ATP-dependent RNA helicase RhlB